MEEKTDDNQFKEIEIGIHPVLAQSVLIDSRAKEKKNNFLAMESEKETVKPNGRFQAGSLLAMFKATFLEVYVDSTIHGPHNIIASRNIIVKIMWALLMMAGLASTIIFCYWSTKSFFDYDVTVSIETINNPPIDFPSGIQPYSY